jgi:hypothetical protein
LAPNFRGDHPSEPVPSELNRLLANVGAALKQQVFGVPQAKRERDTCRTKIDLPIWLDRYYRLFSIGLTN